MLKMVELKIMNLLFQICDQTKHVERLLQKVMRIGTVVLEAKGAYFFVAEKSTDQLILKGQYSVKQDAEFPVSEKELLEICNSRKELWIQHEDSLLVPLDVHGTLNAVLCFRSVARQLDGQAASVVNRIVKRFSSMYRYKRIQQDKENFHKALIEISQVITQSYDFEDVITEAMEMASKVTGGFCGLMLVSKDEQFLLPIYTYSVAKTNTEEIPFPPQPGHDQTSYIAIKERKAVFVEDTDSDPLADHKFCKEHGIRSYMTLPLIVHDRPIGVLYVNHSHKRSFNKLEVTFYTELAHQIGHVINTLQARQEILETKQIQDRLIEMMREMSSRTRLRDVLNDMVVKTHHLLDEKVGVSVWLADESKNKIRLSAWKGTKLRLDRQKGIEFSLEELGNSASLQDRYLELDHQSDMAAFFIKSGADLTIGTPVMAGKDLIGILFLHAKEGHKWSAQEKLTLSAIGTHAGPIIRNGQYIQLLEKESKLDGLTKVYNRQYFEKIYREYSHRHMIQNKPFSILMIDLDNFKQINDRYGHPVGDKVMRVVAQILQDTIRRADKVFRYGGEEFCIFLPWTAKEQAEQVAERIRLSVEEASIDPPVTVSIGVATYLDHSMDSKEILELADLALYQAKSKGKNRVVCAM
ncbi:sensor domain-containing diguanylate cyclase [Effusibacillus consociatus]|uniref:Sensor domain-containing diguanylate cyclase n=1 Tax=Effusibacillus consociatus TaxID=1117041 RepID=A0ABV9PZ69_9BACL